MVIGHQKQQELLQRKFESGQLSHAYVFSGENGIGKKLIAIELVKMLNCTATKKPCQKCSYCQMIDKNSFPDLLLVEKDNDATEIEILQIRKAQKFLSYTPYYGSVKMVIVDNAELMNRESQNAFLKTLEEPTQNSIIILVTAKPDLLLPTILSRVQQIKFFKPKNLPLSSETSEKQKEILKTMLPSLHSDFAEKFKYAKSIDFETQKLEDLLAAMQQFTRHLLLAKIGVEKIEEKDAAFKGYSLQQLSSILKSIEEMNKKILLNNVNQKLALEILLMEF